MKKALIDRILCFIVIFIMLIVAILNAFFPDQEYSEAERRKLADRPEASFASFQNGRFMKETENYVTDQFPFRESFRRIKARTTKDLFMQKDKQGLYEYQGYLIDMEYPLKEDSLKRAASRFRHIYDQYLTSDNHVYVSVIPDKNMFAADKSGHLSMDYERFEQIIKEECSFAQYISLMDFFKLEDYYKTDTHLRQEKIEDAVKFLAESMGTDIKETYKKKLAIKDFHGVYDGQMALGEKGEDLYYMESDLMKDYKVYDGQNQKEIPVYCMDKLKGKDPYEMFLSGPLSLVTIENPSCKNGRNLIIFRDSFASAFAPILAEGYEKVTLVDIRYIHPDYVSLMLSYENSDVLFLYSTLVLNNSDTIK